MAWVYFDLWKNALEKQDWATVSDMKASLFDLPFHQDAMLQTQIYWLVAKTASQAIKHQQPPSFAQKMLAALIHLPTTNDATLTVALLTIAAKIRVDWRGYFSFNLWANITAITEPTDLERIAIPIAKAMLEEQESQGFSYAFYTFFDWLEGLSLQHPELIYVRYYVVQLLVHTQNHQQAQQLVLDLVRAKKNDFWVWQLMATCYKDNAEISHAALCKALALGGKEQMLVGLRQEFAEKLIADNNWQAAKFEIEKVVATRTKEGWKIPTKIQGWLSRPEYKNTTGLATNYGVYTQMAEELLWETAESMLIVITRIDNATQTAFYITENEGGGKLTPQKNQMPSVEIGKVYRAYTKKHATKGYHQVLKLKDTDEKVTWFKAITGVIRINASGLGFVGDTYVAANLVAAAKLQTNMKTKGFAIKSHDHKKKQDGWRAIAINKME